MTGYLRFKGPSQQVFSFDDMPGLKLWDPMTGDLLAKGTSMAKLTWTSDWEEIPPPPGKPHGPVPAVAATEERAGQPDDVEPDDVENSFRP